MSVLQNTPESAGFTEAEIATIRRDFPIVSRVGRGGKPIAYLDSAATSQKPTSVISALTEFYSHTNAAVNRGTHLLGDESTVAFEAARTALASFVGAGTDEIIWTKNATEGLNLLAFALSADAESESTNLHLGSGDEVCATVLEHHANLVPWQQACARTGAKLTWFDATAEGRLDLSDLESRINPRTKVVAVTHASNVTGAITDLAPIVERAHQVGALVVLDSCQSSAHMPLSLHDLGVDAAVFSAHKMMGPTGIGALYLRADLMERLGRFLTGGAMVTDVSMESASFYSGPAGFEAGTQPVAEAVAWAKALDYYSYLGFENIVAHEHEIGHLMLEGLAKIPRVRVLGPSTMESRLAVMSFDIAGIHPHDVGQILDAEDIAVRVGHHCAIPIHRHFGVRSSTRASASVTTTVAEVDRLISGINRVIEFFGE